MEKQIWQLAFMAYAQQSLFGAYCCVCMALVENGHGESVLSPKSPFIIV
ncbi:hypothetical protein AALC75_10870 [Lachnospiraceae bacterium 48-42]